MRKTQKQFALLLSVALLLGGCGTAAPSSAPPTAAPPAPDATPAATGASSAAAPERADPLDELLAGMTLEQKIGQLFLVRPDALDGTQTQEQINDAKADGVTAVTDGLRAMLAQYPVGGLALFGKNITGPAQVQSFIADWQAASALPLFIAVDEEGGAIARLANHKAFPDLPDYESAAAVGAEGQAAALAMGRSIGAYLREYGFNLDFAPVADVNTNPENPVIGTRAFSDDPAQAAALAAAMAQGLREQAILPTFKHFPGHGDTAEDSHYGLAVLRKTPEELQTCEWLPYGFGSAPPLPAGSYAVMVGHIAVPALTGDETPASLCPELVTDVLKTQLYDPLVITDSLAMEGVTDRYPAGEAAVLALRAGCDVLLMPDGLAEAFGAVRQAVEEGTLSQERLDASVRKILQYKAEYGILVLPTP